MLSSVIANPPLSVKVPPPFPNTDHRPLPKCSEVPIPLPPIPPPLHEDSPLLEKYDSASRIPMILPDPPMVAVFPEAISEEESKKFPPVSEIKVCPPPPLAEFTDCQVMFLSNRRRMMETIVKGLSAPQTAAEKCLWYLNELIEIGQIAGDIGMWYSSQELISALRVHLLNHICAIRIATLRALIGFTKKPSFVRAMSDLSVGYLIAHCLERDPSVHDSQGQERLDALQLISTCTKVSAADMSRPEVSALVAVVNSARKPKPTPFYEQCMFALCRLAIVNPKLVWECRGMKVIFSGVLNPAYQSLMGTFVATTTFLLDDETTRKYIRLNEEFSTIFQPLLGFVKIDQGPSPTSVEGIGVPKQVATKEAIENWQYQYDASLRFLGEFLQTWTGIVVMTCNRLFEPLVRALQLPQPEVHEKVLDTIFNALHAQIPTKENPFVPARETTQSSSAVKESFRHIPIPPPIKRHYNVLNYMTALVLMGLLNAGLIEALVDMVKEPARSWHNNHHREQQIQPSAASASSSTTLRNSAPSTTTKAVVLLGELHFLSNMLLPPSHCMKFEQLPALMEGAASFGSSEVRSRASSVVMNLHSYSKLRAERQDAFSRGPHRHSNRDYRLERIDDVKLQLDWSISEARLLERIQATRVVSSKDYTNTWQWDMIVDLLEGSLSNPLNTELAIKSKFYPRLMTFFKPKEKQFSRLTWGEVRQAYVRSGTAMLQNLMLSEAGTQYLAEEKLLTQIADALKQELAAIKEEHDVRMTGTDSDSSSSGSASSSRLFSQSSFASSSAREYLMIIGQLTSTSNGIELLKKSRVLDYLNALREYSSREDLNYAVLKSLDYRSSEDARKMLAAFVLSESKLIRTAAIRYVRVLLRMTEKQSAKGWAEWAIPLLSACFNDSEAIVREEAFSICQEACESYKECTNVAISILPNPQTSIQRFRDGEELILRYLSRPFGIKLLASKGVVDQEFERWEKSANVAYLENLDAELFAGKLWNDRNANATATVFMKPHLFGQLAHSREGRELLRKRGVVANLTSQITNPLTPAVHQRAALLALGHIAQSRKAFDELLKSALTLIRTIAETSPSMSLRGTAFLVLGMFCHNPRAVDTLQRQGWVTLDTGTDFGVAVPANLSQHPFFTIPPLRYEFPQSTCNAITSGSSGFLSPEQQKIFANFELLINPVVDKDVSPQLTQLLRDNPAAIHQPELMVAALQLLENYQMYSSNRRFIYGLTLGSLPANYDIRAFMSVLDRVRRPPTSSTSSSSSVEILPPPPPPDS